MPIPLFRSPSTRIIQRSNYSDSRDSLTSLGELVGDSHHYSFQACKPMVSLSWIRCRHCTGVFIIWVNEAKKKHVNIDTYIYKNILTTTKLESLIIILFFFHIPFWFFFSAESYLPNSNK